MKKPEIDYRELRLSNITDKRFSHLFLIFGWVGYFVMYFVTEKFVPYEKCHVMHWFLDDLIPFCEIFVVPYVFWYFLVFGTLLYFLLYRVESFRKVMIYIIVTQIIAMAVYILFPNRQDLRPEVFPRNNVFSYLVGLIYSVDTSTNVCPSMHVAYSIAVASAWLKEKTASRGFKIFVVTSAVVICLSTAFIKQHSTLDAVFALPMCAFAEYVAYSKYSPIRLFSKKK